MKSITIGAALVTAALLVAGCTDPTTAQRILETDGVSQVEFTGYDFFACGEDDFYHTGFRGVKNGKSVSGVVCAGFFFKASTVRYH